MKSRDSLLALAQADLKSQLGDAGYVVFGVVLFVWELLPTTLVVYFFRVRNPTKDLVSTPSLSVCWCPESSWNWWGGCAPLPFPVALLAFLWGGSSRTLKRRIFFSLNFLKEMCLGILSVFYKRKKVKYIS
jgi:hypothetical protein